MAVIVQNSGGMAVAWQGVLKNPAAWRWHGTQMPRYAMPCHDAVAAELISLVWSHTKPLSYQPSSISVIKFLDSSSGALSEVLFILGAEGLCQDAATWHGAAILPWLYVERHGRWPGRRR